MRSALSSLIDMALSASDLRPDFRPRDHDSYVVKANGKHYWPRVSLLSIGGV